MLSIDDIMITHSTANQIPPYSPGIYISDFFLCNYLKDRVKNSHIHIFLKSVKNIGEDISMIPIDIMNIVVTNFIMGVRAVNRTVRWLQRAHRALNHVLSSNFCQFCKSRPIFSIFVSKKFPCCIDNITNILESYVK